MSAPRKKQEPIVSCLCDPGTGQVCAGHAHDQDARQAAMNARKKRAKQPDTRVTVRLRIRPPKPKQPVVHCVIVRSTMNPMALSIRHVDGGMGGHFKKALADAGFHEGDQVSIVMRRSGPKRKARKC